MGKARNVLINSALCLGSTVLALLLVWAAGEVVLRAQYGDLPTEAGVPMRRYDPQRGWALRPGTYSYFDVRAVRRVDVTINELGLRDAPLAPEPSAGVERITLLGDSFVFCAPVAQDATIAAKFQALAGRRDQIVNAGVPGYGTGQEYLLLEELRAKGYHTGRKLVLAFFTNDLQDNVGLNYSTLSRNPAQPAFSVDAGGNLKLSPPEPPARSIGGATGRPEGSLFVQLVRYQLEALVAGRARDSSKRCGRSGSARNAA